MISKTFRKIINFRSGAVEMIEGTFVIPLVILSISLLIIITLVCLNSILSKEIKFQEGLTLLMNEDYQTDIAARVKNVSKIEGASIVKKQGILRENITLTSNESNRIIISHIDTGSFIRKVDFSESLLKYISQIKVGGTSLQNLIDSHMNSLNKLKEKLR